MTTEIKRPPFVYNLHKKDNSLNVPVLAVSQLLPNSESDVRHIIFDVSNTDYTYYPGQSAGIIPPGINPKTNKPRNIRLYSVASSLLAPEPGFENKKTVTLCVKRVREPHWDDKDVMFEGVCSNLLCNLKVGDTVSMTGPAGKHFLLPADTFAMNYIFCATGTGIAPFRAMLREMHALGGIPTYCQVWLFFGVRTQENLIYHEEFLALAQQYPNFHYHWTLSRSMQHSDGSKKYVQHLLLDHPTEILALLQQPTTHTYVCGTKGMEAGIALSIEELAQSAGLEAEKLTAEVTQKERYYEEVY